MRTRRKPHPLHLTAGRLKQWPHHCCSALLCGCFRFRPEFSRTGIGARARTLASVKKKESAIVVKDHQICF